jgi:hypothetical protein
MDLQSRMACVVQLEGLASNPMRRIERWQFHAMTRLFGQAHLRIGDDGVAPAEPPATLKAIAS